MAELAYYLPAGRRSLAELHADGLLSGSPETLATFGFEYAHVADGETHLEMAVEAARQVLDRAPTDPAEVGLLLYATALTGSATMAGARAVDTGTVLRLDSVAECFQYPAPYLQAELELTRATVAGVDQQGCASLMSALRIGRAMLAAEPELGTVLCVSADVFPAGQPRDLVYNVISDGACAVLLRRGAPNRILACAQVTKGSYWDAAAVEHEVMAAYFPTAKNLITTTLASAGLGLDDIALVIPHNVSLRSWDILRGLLELPADRVFTDNIARVGHTIASDNILNLRDAIDRGRVSAGDKLLLFTFGFGLNWSCMVVEH
jgi:3-oxoacyl-[acyl-carrier-protein] synthase-3